MLHMTSCIYHIGVFRTSKVDIMSTEHKLSVLECNYEWNEHAYNYKILRSRTQNPVKHLRWSFLRK